MHWRSGSNVCSNDLEIPMDTADAAAALEAIEDDVLDQRLVEDVMRDTLAELLPPAEQVDERRRRLQETISTLDADLGRLSAAIAAGAPLDVLVADVKQRSERHAAAAAQLDVLERQSTAAGDELALQQRVGDLLKDWRGLLWRHAPQARQILSKLLHGPLAVTPERRKGVRGFRTKRRRSVSAISFRDF